MMTSGLTSAIHCFENSKPLNTGAQYGVSVSPASHAAPMAGTCEQFTLATILAMVFHLRFASIALDRAAAVQHHLRIFLFCGARHFGGDLRERETVGGENLREEIDIAAELDHAVPVPLQDSLALLLCHRPFLQVLRLVRLELRALLGLHERHAEHVEV